MLLVLLFTALAPFLVLARKNHAERERGCPTLSISKHLKHANATGKYNPIQSDRKRVRKFTNGHQRYNSEAIDEVSLNYTGGSFVAEVGFGIPPTFYSLVVDTGSSITWVGANKSYVSTSTSVLTKENVTVVYGSARFDGYVYNDTVTIAPNVTISQQPIGVAFNSSGISPHDGILGIGPKDLTQGTLYPDNTTVIPTVTDSLFNQGEIKQNLVGVSFEPLASSLGYVQTGELTFGATDPARYTGDIQYFPLTNTTPSSEFWGVNATFKYGNTSDDSAYILNGTGIIDTGTTLIYLSSDAYERYATATGAVFDKATERLSITRAQYKTLKPLFFVILGSPFELTPDTQIWPCALNKAIGGDADHFYLNVIDSGNQNPGVDFLVGMAFLERYYSVFDTGNRRLGLATTQFTNAKTNSNCTLA